MVLSASIKPLKLLLPEVQYYVRENHQEEYVITDAYWRNHICPI